MTSLAELRKNYSLGSLDVADIDRNPFRQFDTWFRQAVDAKLPEPNTMTLATVDARGRPSARIVLIKGVDERGFVFFTNYESRKGRELAANPYASLLFYWIELERQVRIEGRIVKTSAEESDAYFASRPLGSRIGAWASKQSQVIESRVAARNTRSAKSALQYGDHPPRPPHWGGYRLVPDSNRILAGPTVAAARPSCSTRVQANGSDWQISRLSP